MTRLTESLLAVRLESISRSASATVILAGCAVLLAWVFDIAVLKSVIPGLATMKVNTALSFVLAGTSLWLSQAETGVSRSHFIAKGFAVLITLIAALTLVQYVTGYDLAIDQLLALDPATHAAAYPGRMALATALNFLFLGAALLLLDVETEGGHHPSQWLVACAGTISLIALIGYAYNIQELFRIGPYSTLALHTAVAFLVLSLGISCARPDRGLPRVLSMFRLGLMPQVVALVLVAVLLSGGLVSISMVRQSQHALREQIIANNLADADLIAEFAWRYMQGAQSGLEFLAKSDQLRQAVSSGDYTRATATLHAFHAVNDWLNSCSLYDTSGMNRASGNTPEASDIGASVSDRQWFQQWIAAGKPYLDVPLLSRVNKRPVVSYTMPVLNYKGEVAGLLVGEISLEATSNAITRFRTGPSARAALVDRRHGGILLAHPDHKRILQPVSGKNAATARLLAGERGTLETSNSDGDLNLTAFAPVPNLPWGVLLLQPSRAVFAPIEASARHGLLLIAVLVIFTALGATGLALHVIRPLVDLRAAVNSLAAGDITKRLNFSRRDELGDLGRAFDQMAAALAERNAELKTVNRELQEQNRQVQEANRLKSEFLANMSHELRTPLNAIIGFAQLMHDGKVGTVSAPHQEYLGDILGSARHLLQLINDILDLSKIEAGKMEFRPEPVQLTKLIGEVRQILQALSASKRIEIAVEVSADVDQLVIDPAKLKQVLYNYLSNAVKFTPDEGRIRVRAMAQGPDRFRLEVEDTGFGVSPQDLGKLFVEFQQLESGTAKKHPGTGLGLALTKKIVERQGGQVGVQSDPPGGSVFYALLPRIAAQSDGAKASGLRAARPAGAGPAVLVVEDDESDRRWLTQILEGAGYSVDSAVTGSDGMAKAQANAYRGVLLDLILPDAGGWEVLRSIRAGGPNQQAPVIVVSVVAEKSVASGFPVQDYLVKPLQPRTLLDALNKAGISQKSVKKKILVVDDDANTLTLAKAALDASGYDAVCYSSGKNGLAAAADSEFCAVVLDLLMPEIDGFEFLERLRKIDACRQTPVVIWTSKDVTGADRERLKQSAQSIALKGQGGVDALLRELQRHLPPAVGDALAGDDGPVVSAAVAQGIPNDMGANSSKSSRNYREL